MSRTRSWTDDQLVEAVRTSYSLAEVLRKLGLHIGGGTYDFVKASIKRLELDTTHFTGQLWSKGKKLPYTYYPPKKHTLEDVLVEGPPKINSHTLRQRLLRAGIFQHVCASCGLSEWQGHPIPLELDHIDGRRDNNKLDNLRLLCPNCHALTDTYCGKNIGRYT